MNPDPLPPDLRDLEARLARRPGPEPAADFRARVLGATADAFARRGGPRWGLVWRAAAVLVVALNLGLSAANGVRYQRLTPVAQQRPAPPAAVNGEDRFLALAAPALANWTPAPDTGMGRCDLFRTE